MARTLAGERVASGPFASMSTLHVALHDGFANDRVVVKVDAQEVARLDGVSTKYQIGLATTVDVEVTAGRVELEIDVETQHLSGRAQVDVALTPYVGVSIEAGAVVCMPQSEPFRYL